MDPTEAVFALIKLATDPAGCAKRMAELKAAEQRAEAAEQKAAAAGAVTEQKTAAFEQREKELRDREVKVFQMESALQHRHEELCARARAQTVSDDQAKKRVLERAGLHDYSNALQDLPTWVELDRRIGTADPHYGRSADAPPGLRPEDVSPAFRIKPGPGTLTQAQPASAAERRRQRLAHEPRLQGDGGRQ